MPILTPDKKRERLFTIKCKGRDLGSKKMMKQLEEVWGQSKNLTLH